MSLAAFLAGLAPCVEECAQWNAIALDVHTYLHDALPPDDYITSVRAVVFTELGVALLSNPNETHVLPGGRREPGETLLQTLHREVREETGCRIVAPAHLIGFIHCRHTTPRPPAYRYPYPDFLQPVYAVSADVVERAADPAGWEQAVAFVSVAEALREPLPASQRLLLEAAARRLGVGD